MEINAFTPPRNSHATPPAPKAIAHPASENSKAKLTHEVAEIAQDDSGAVAVVSDVESDGDKVSGVMRLLQDGHFRGVADVRLRINFHDEISALQSEKEGAVIEEGVGDIIEALQTELTASLEASPPEGDLAASIDEESALMFAELMSIPQRDTGESSLRTSDVISEIQAAFDTFVISISASPEEESSDGTPDMVSSGLNAATLLESGEEEGEKLTTQEALDQLIANLTETFSSKLSSLEKLLNEISVLPDLSGPTGNGKAYNKFLAIYSNMYGLAGDSPPPEQVDAVA